MDLGEVGWGDVDGVWGLVWLRIATDRELL
jgi:hypothetical protein